MEYQNIVQGTFLRRPNRFIAHVMVGNIEVICHVKNTGRCRELLIEGCTVYLERATNPARKTQFDLVAVEKMVDGKPLLINMDAQAPNKVFREWMEGGHFVDNLSLIRAESTYGKSRFDFYYEAGDRQGYVEVKGVTLEVDGHAYFPDAPTQRGVKHLEELLTAHRDGYEATVCFVVQMEGMQAFSPNDATHPAFGDALRRIAHGGVQVLVLGCHVTPGTLTITTPIPLAL